MVAYRLKNDLQNLIVCLYYPNGESIDHKFSTDSVANYIQDCFWQISQGEPVQRFPYHITAAAADAKRVEDEMKSHLVALRKEL